jgi:hypothetical protein
MHCRSWHALPASNALATSAGERLLALWTLWTLWTAADCGAATHQLRQTIALQSTVIIEY